MEWLMKTHSGKIQEKMIVDKFEVRKLSAIFS